MTYPPTSSYQSRSPAFSPSAALTGCGTVVCALVVSLLVIIRDDLKSQTDGTRTVRIFLAASEARHCFFALRRGARLCARALTSEKAAYGLLWLGRTSKGQNLTPRSRDPACTTLHLRRKRVRETCPVRLRPGVSVPDVALGHTCSAIGPVQPFTGGRWGQDTGVPRGNALVVTRCGRDDAVHDCQAGKRAGSGG